jgi:integrase/recombinase XerC
MSEWLDFLREEGKSENTIKSYGAQLLLFERWFKDSNIEELTPERVTSIDLREYMSYLKNVEGKKARTINLMFSAIRSWLVYNNQVIKVPKAVKVTSSAPRSLTRIEQNALMRAVERADDLKGLAVITFLKNTGLRLSEAVALNIEDLQIAERSGKVLVRHGKGMKEREVPLNGEARRVLKAYLNNRTKGPVFLSQKGNLRLSNSGIYQLVVKYAYQSKIGELHPHTLRHTFAKNLLEAGEDLGTIAVLLGHENINTTVVYTRPTQEDLEKAVERLSDD